MTKSKSKRPMKWAKTEGEEIAERSYAQGAFRAAEVAALYDDVSNHDHVVSDCILSKLNLRAGKPRKNKHANDTKSAWTRGYAAALGALVRWDDDVSGARKIMQQDGLTIADLRAAGVPAFDLDPIRAGRGGRGPKGEKGKKR